MRSPAPSRLVFLALLAAPVVALATPSASEVKKALKSGDPSTVSAMLASLDGQLDADLVKAIIENAARLKTLGVYDGLIGALSTARGEALAELEKGYGKQKRADVRFLIVDALAKVPEASAEQVLVEALEEDEDETVAVLAARSLGRRATKSAVEALIPTLEAFEKQPQKLRLVREVNGALGMLTGQDLAVAQDWKNYWDSHKEQFTPPAQPDADGGSQTKDRNAIDRMARERPADLRTMTRLREDDVIVVKSVKHMDEVEVALAGLKIKHKLVEKAELEGMELDPSRQVVVMQCGGKGDESMLSDAGVQKVREFVSRGGYLISSDLQLGYVLAKAFPEVVTRGGKTSNRGTVPISIAPNPEAVNHPLMRDVFPLNSWQQQQYKWQLFTGCDVAAPHEAITELVTSPEMKDLSQHMQAVAFTFTFPPGSGGAQRAVTGGGKRRSPGGGVVLHVLSHWKLQAKDDGDGFALQQILLNLIVDKQDRHRAELAGGN